MAPSGENTGSPAPVRLTQDKWDALNAINNFVNQTVRAQEDKALYNREEWWTYPSEAGGDCEDYALLKRKRLIEAGWPEGNLLLSIVREYNGGGHAVLVVITDKGDYVLDNQNRHIVAWQDAPYFWIKRQSQTNPYQWVSLKTRANAYASNTKRPHPNITILPHALPSRENI